jgi:hypothetical protein
VYRHLQSLTVDLGRATTSSVFSRLTDLVLHHYLESFRSSILHPDRRDAPVATAAPFATKCDDGVKRWKHIALSIAHTAYDIHTRQALGRQHTSEFPSHRCPYTGQLRGIPSPRRPGTCFEYNLCTWLPGWQDGDVSTLSTCPGTTSQALAPGSHAVIPLTASTSRRDQ